MNGSPEGQNVAIADPIDITVTDVTGMQNVEIGGLDGHRTASDVAASIAAELSLSDEVPWALRENSKARMLVDDNALGSQIESGTELTIIPKAHLA